MYVVSVSIHVKSEAREDFLKATLENAINTRKEPGNVRFDVLEQADDPNRFLLYEVYNEEAGFRAHQQTRHYLDWRETVADWMAGPREGIKHNSIFPSDADW